MPTARVFHTSGFQGVPLTPLSRVLFNGLPLTVEGTSGIVYFVKRLDNGVPLAVAGPTSLSPSAVLFDAVAGNLKGSPGNPDPRWDKDLTGFNFAPTIPPTDFAEADEYWITFAFTPSSGYPFVQIVRATIISNLGAFG
jgi:hypothetical protein